MARAMLVLSLLVCGCAGSAQSALNQCNEDYRVLNTEHQSLQRVLQSQVSARTLRAAVPNGDGGESEGEAPEIVLSTLSGDALEGLLQDFGFGFERVRPDAYMFQLSNTRVILFNKGTSLQLYAGFHAKPSLIKVNEWNQMARFSRAYLDQEGDAIIEFDLDLESGWTREGIQEFIETFGLVVEAYRMFLSAPDEQRTTASL